ncbi:hypothetical protein MVEN_02292500 [Mycena venus]|uniref:Uncharacterized protein n=1 Tax=Mycena venus TaxID=2733690 RepID=A0A8H6X525_9AGAR|nr:hypothetical protein MVEN_02292500 [Mycena venus]
MKYASRKYIDLILEVSSKWASWDPPHPIKVGDYGTIDKATGRFEKDGNIYDDPNLSFVRDHQPEILPPEEKMVFTSQTAQTHEFNLGPEVTIPGIAEASIKGQWKFKSGKTGAVLVIAQPRSSLISGNASALFKTLLDLDLPHLKDKFLVTETVACPAYGLYLSNKTDDTISLALLASTPLPIPVISAGGSIEAKWYSQTGAGVFRHGCAPLGPGQSYSFTPLFVIKRLRKRGTFGWRGRGAPEEEGEQENLELEDADKPWAPLDEDGEEEPFEDPVYD